MAETELEACAGWLDIIDLNRIVPALPFLPVKGETVLSPGDGVLTRVVKVTPVPGSANRYVVAGRVLRRSKPVGGGKGRQSGTDTAWMFRLVKLDGLAERQHALEEQS